MKGVGYLYLAIIFCPILAVELMFFVLGPRGLGFRLGGGFQKIKGYIYIYIFKII